MLGSHSQVACGPESYLVGQLASKLEYAVEDPHWPTRSMQLLEKDCWDLFGRFGLEKIDVKQYLTSVGPDAKSIIECVPKMFAEKEGKARWAEKTPSHLWYLQDIRSLFSDAPIICIFRDPRDAVTSLIKLQKLHNPNSSKRLSYTRQYYYLIECYHKIQSFIEQDSLTFSLRLEDLIESPADKLSSICDFIGETFEPAMVERNRAGSLIDPKEWAWKQGVTRPLDPSKCYEWRHILDRDLASLGSIICHDAIAALNYPDPVAPELSVPVHPITHDWAEVNEVQIQLLAQHKVRLYDPFSKTFSKNFEKDFDLRADWNLGGLPLGLGKVSRFQKLNVALWILLIRRLQGNPVRYIQGFKPGTDRFQIFFAMFLKLLGQSISVEEIREEIISP